MGFRIRDLVQKVHDLLQGDVGASDVFQHLRVEELHGGSLVPAVNQGLHGPFDILWKPALGGRLGQNRLSPRRQASVQPAEPATSSSRMEEKAFSTVSSCSGV